MGISNENGVGICEHTNVNVMAKQLACLSVQAISYLKEAGNLRQRLVFLQQKWKKTHQGAQEVPLTATAGV